jgi:hypothetical protein
VPWQLLFGFIPVDRHRVELVALPDEGGFPESSSSWWHRVRPRWASTSTRSEVMGRRGLCSPRSTSSDSREKGSAMAHPHLDLLTELDEAFNRQDFEGVLARFTDDAKVYVSGKSKLGGSYSGKEQFGAVMGQYIAALGEVQDMATHDMLANDGHGVQLQKVTATKGSKTITIDTVNVFHFADGKISEMWTMDFNQHEADAYYDA